MQNRKRKQKNSKKFNAYQYANDFEKLSLEIVKILYKNSLNDAEPIYDDITQETRDYGVDAYLVVNIKERLQTYTIEAKLRTSDTLSLKDFATSIYIILLIQVQNILLSQMSLILQK